MTRFYTTVDLLRPVHEVFDFVTIPGNWPQWHPSSLGVSGEADHSLEVGEQVTEAFRVAGRRGSAVWTCLEREAPRHWVIEGQVEEGGAGTITYTLTPHNGGTRFERTFVYALPNRLWEVLNRLFLRRRIAAESDEALRRLKHVLEAG